MNCLFLERGRFPMRSPESQGIPSSALLSFLRGCREQQAELHSFHVFRHGYCVAEGYARPFEPWSPHRIYSAAKNISGLAVLFALDEGRCALTTPVLGFFPERRAGAGENLRRLTLYHLMTMTTGHETDPFDSSLKQGLNWQDGFFGTPLVHKPGTHFLYNNTVPYMLGVIVRRLTGQNYIDYLRPRFLDPVGIHATVEYTKDGDWELEGSSTVSTPEGVAKLTLFYLQRGMWNGRQLLSRALMEQATSYLVPCSWRNSPDTNCWGYGLQMWQSQIGCGGFEVNGGHGQIGVCRPDLELAVVWTGWDASLTAQRLCRDEILKHVYAKPLPESPEACGELRDYLADWSVLPGLAPASPREAELAGRWLLPENPWGIGAVTLDFSAKELIIEQEGREIAIAYGVEGGFACSREYIRRLPDDPFSTPLYQCGAHLVRATGGWAGDTFTVQARPSWLMVCDFFEFTPEGDSLLLLAEGINARLARMGNSRFVERDVNAPKSGYIRCVRSR